MIRRTRVPMRSTRRPAARRRFSSITRPQRPSRSKPVAKRRATVRSMRAQPVVRRKAHPGKERTRPTVFVGPRKRPPSYRWRHRYWGSPWPYLLPVDYVSNDVIPGSNQLSAKANKTLHRLGLQGGIWRARWAEAEPELIRFINRFHRATGLNRVLEDYYQGRYWRVVAQMAMRLSLRLAGNNADYARTLHFDRRITLAPDNNPIVSIVVGYKGVHYRLFPWRRLHSQALRRQLRRDAMAYGNPQSIRWVFSSKRLKTGTDGQLRNQLRRILDDSGGQTERRWASTLGRTALVI